MKKREEDKNPHTIGPKPTLRTLCIQHSLLDVLKLARVTGLNPLVIWGVIAGFDTSVETAQILLCGINATAGTHYTMYDIRDVLKPRET